MRTIRFQKVSSQGHRLFRSYKAPPDLGRIMDTISLHEPCLLVPNFLLAYGFGKIVDLPLITKGTERFNIKLRTRTTSIFRLMPRCVRSTLLICKAPFLAFIPDQYSRRYEKSAINEPPGIPCPFKHTLFISIKSAGITCLSISFPKLSEASLVFTWQIINSHNTYEHLRALLFLPPPYNRKMVVQW